MELKDGTYTVASIAATGKGEAYVYSRVKLTYLTPPVAEAFLIEKITTGQALLIANPTHRSYAVYEQKVNDFGDPRFDTRFKT